MPRTAIRVRATHVGPHPARARCIHLDRFTQFTGNLVDNQIQRDMIEAYIRARGDGVTMEAGSIKPLASTTQTIIQGQGAYTVWVRDIRFLDQSAALTAVERGSYPGKPPSSFRYSSKRFRLPSWPPITTPPRPGTNASGP